jgi:hypothetical protein
VQQIVRSKYRVFQKDLNDFLTGTRVNRSNLFERPCIAYGEMRKPTSGLMKCCVFVETVATDMNIVYGPEFSAGNSTV